MSSIAPLNPATTTGPARELFDGIRAKIGIVPNLYRVMGHAPAVLKGNLDLSAALSSGTLSAKVREQLALVVAETNQCGYCLSAHSFIGGRLGLTDAELTEARSARAADPHTAALLRLARTIVVQRGELDSDDLREARSAGVTDGEILEVIGHVALNIFTNYINHIAQTPIDFPEVAPGDAHARIGV